MATRDRRRRGSVTSKKVWNSLSSDPVSTRHLTAGLVLLEPPVPRRYHGRPNGLPPRTPVRRTRRRPAPPAWRSGMEKPVQRGACRRGPTIGRHAPLPGRTVAAGRPRRLVRVREELAVLDEQLAVLTDTADDARIRSLVSETPLAGHEYADAQRSADAANRGRAGTARHDRRAGAPPGRAPRQAGRRAQVVRRHPRHVAPTT